MIKVSASGIQKKQDQDGKNVNVQSKELNARIQKLKSKTSEKKAGDIPKFHISKQGNLKSLKILSAPEEVSEDVREITQDNVPPEAVSTQSRTTTYEENLAPLLIERDNITRVNIIGAILTGAWFGACAYFLFKTHGAALFSLSTIELGAYLSFILAPPALLWLVLSNIQRRSDVEHYTVLLRSELHNILFPQGEHPDKIGKDIERLCQQASELAASSQTVMKSIQTARYGLREDIKEFVGMSEQTERHMEALSKNLTDKTEKLLTLSEEIEARFDKIRKSGETALKNTAEVSACLSDAADRVEGQNNDALSRLETVEHNLTAQTSGLSIIADDLEGSAGRLTDDLTIQLGHIEDASTRIFNQLEDSTQKLGAQKEVFEGLTHDLESKLSRIDKIGEASGVLEKSLIELKDVVSRIEDAGDVAANALGESLNLAVSGSDALRESVLSSTNEFQDSLNTAISKTDNLIAKAFQKVKSIQEREGDHKDYLSTYLSDFEAQQQRLSDVKNQLVSDLDKTSDELENRTEALNTTLTKLGEMADTSGTVLNNSLGLFENHLNSFDQRQNKLTAMIETRMGSLGNIGGKVLDQVEQTAKNLRDQVQNVSSLSGKVAAQTGKLNKDIHDQNDLIISSLQTTMKNMSDISVSLEKNVEHAELHANKSENIINNINNNIKVNSEELKGLSEGSINTLRSFGNQINEELARFDEICENLEEKAQRTSFTIEETMIGIQPNCQEIFSKIENVGSRFDGLKDTITAISDENITRLEKLGQEFDLQLLNVNKVTAEAITEIDQVGDHLDIHVEQIKDATSKSVKYINDARREMEGEISAFGLMGDDIAVKIGEAQKALDTQNNELSEVIGHSVAQIKGAAIELGETARMTADVSEEVVAQITESLTHTEIQTESFHKAAQSHLKETSSYTAQIAAKTDHILQQTKDSLKELDKARLGVNARHKEMEAQLESVLRMSGYYSEEIRKNAKLVAQNAQDSTQSISKAGQDLKKEIGNLNVVTDDVTLKIKAAQKDLGQESRDLIRVSTEVLKTSEKTSQNFAKYSHQLSKLGQEIKTSAIDLRQVMTQQEEEHFMSSARYLLESIYALTVDLTRALDGEISEKMWKSFNDGENDVFMRHLQKIEKNIPAAKLKEKFAKDPEFRSYAKRYMGQFEKMFRQLQSIENNELLQSAIGSSDTAKLYQMLVKSSGQKDIMASI